MKSTILTLRASAVLGAMAIGCGPILADDDHDKRDEDKDLPSYTELRAALRNAVTNGPNGGLGFNMWATLVDRDGIVSVVTFSGGDRGDQWPGSRVISAQKANTANSFSVKGLALSTANLYSAVQPGGTLFGLQESHPINTDAAYAGPSSNYGKRNDPMVGKRIGGVNVFGGGLALYDKNGKIVGGLGVSGDTSCTDHIIAWKVRHALNLDNVPGGVSPTHDDNVVYDIAPDGNGHPVSAGGFGHPGCDMNAIQIATNLPTAYPTGPNP